VSAVRWGAPSHEVQHRFDVRPFVRLGGPGSSTPNLGPRFRTMLHYQRIRHEHIVDEANAVFRSKKPQTINGDLFDRVMPEESQSAITRKCEEMGVAGNVIAVQSCGYSYHGNEVQTRHQTEESWPQVR